MFVMKNAKFAKIPVIISVKDVLLTIIYFRIVKLAKISAHNFSMEKDLPELAKIVMIRPTVSNVQDKMKASAQIVLIQLYLDTILLNLMPENVFLYVMTLFTHKDQITAVNLAIVTVQNVKALIKTSALSANFLIILTLL